MQPVLRLSGAVGVAAPREVIGDESLPSDSVSGEPDTAREVGAALEALADEGIPQEGEAKGG